MSTVAAPTPATAAWRERVRMALSEASAVQTAEGTRLLLCAGISVALLAAAAADNGGYDSTVWLGGAIGLVVLAVWARIVFGPTRQLGRWGRLALAAMTLYTAWSFASILWATDKGAALIGSDRTLLYLVLFWLFAGLEFTRRRLELTLAAYLLAIGVVAVAILCELATGPAPQLVMFGQLAAGLGYHNGTAALGTIGAGGSILASSSRTHRPVVRAALVAGATACLEISLLAQSRGWLYTLPVIAVVIIAITPRRGRTAAWALIPSLAALATLPWVRHGWALADGTARAGQTVAGVDVTTARVALLAAFLGGAVAFAVARMQRRYVLSRRGRRMARLMSRAAAAGATVGAMALAGLLVLSGKLASGLHEFTSDAPLRSGVSHFAELGGGRYDIWRVAFLSFLHHPLGGLGQDNFAQAYVASRRTPEEPLWTHSLELRLLTHTGLIGFLLFAAFIAFALVVWRRAGYGDPRLRLAMAAALVPLIVWVIHGSVDWFWELPALSGAAFAFLGAVVSLDPERGDRPTGRPRASALWIVATGIVLLALVPAYLGERALEQGQALTATKPAAALSDLSLSAKLEPFNAAPIALEAGIKLRAGDGAGALKLADSGIGRNPGDWVLWLEKGLAAGALNQSALERAALIHARALDPREPVIALALQRAGTRDPLTIGQAASALATRASQRVAP